MHQRALQFLEPALITVEELKSKQDQFLTSEGKNIHDEMKAVALSQCVFYSVYLEAT